MLIWKVNSAYKQMMRHFFMRNPMWIWIVWEWMRTSIRFLNISIRITWEWTDPRQNICTWMAPTRDSIKRLGFKFVAKRFIECLNLNILAWFWIRILLSMTTLPTDVLKLIYFSLVHSHLTHLCGISGLAANVHLKPVHILQNRALKTAYDLPILTNTLELFNDHVKTVLPVRALHYFQILKFVRQCLNNEILHNIQFEFDTNITNLRDNLRLMVPRVKTNFGRKRMVFLGPTKFKKPSCWCTFC
jgi:hypothetical protein